MNIYTASFMLFAVFGFLKMTSDPAPPQSGDTDSKFLTDVQLAPFLPQELKNLKRISYRRSPEKHGVMAYYGNDEVVLSISDAAWSNYKEVKEFNDSYHEVIITENLIRFPKVRNGYKTITEIREESSISFVFNERFLITIGGLAHQTPSRLWSYMELRKLKPLDRF